MSVMAILAAGMVASAAVPSVADHSVQIEHRGGIYRVDYRPMVETNWRTIGIAPPTRTSTQRCIITATISVQRVIVSPQSLQELKSMLPAGKEFTRHLPGDCKGRQGQASDLVANKSAAIGSHMVELAAADRHNAIAAIDAAHHFAAN